MQYFRRLIFALTALMLSVSALSCAVAEAPWQADLLALLEPQEVPATTTIEYELEIPTGAQTQRRAHAVELVSSKGDVLHVEVAFELVNLPLSDQQWTEVTDWVKSVVIASVQSIRADSKSLANVVANGIAVQRNAARSGDDRFAVWANDNLMVESISASVPYYPTLQKGDSGASVQRLQQRLIALGFLNDKADGHFGSNTQAAVQALEKYVRLLEQDMIDARPAVTAMPTSTPTDIIPLTLSASAEGEAETAQALTPMTTVDGVADALLQAYVFSNHFQTARRALQNGDTGDDVQRVQQRLSNLGYMTAKSDGIYGASTARSLRIFQHYNDLPLTGLADADTQKALFSMEAARPGNAMLTTGTSGEAVSRLQKRLRVLGFGSLSVDGDFGASTKTGVENLQRYMQELESEAIAASTGSQPEGIQLSTVVDGVADPLLLDEFYAETFPAIPDTLDSGSKGRDVIRLQRRLNLLEYYYGTLDGDYGAGTQQAVQDFQKRHGLIQTGLADRATLEKLFDESAMKALKPYVLKVSEADQRVYAYGLDDNNEYTRLVRTMKCSTGRKGSATPKGTFTSTSPGARWHYFKKFNCWAQYAYYIEGDIMFHSVLYNQKGGRVTQSSVNNLGSRASHGCVRLSVEDAKWVWTNCPKNTKVIVY